MSDTFSRAALAGWLDNSGVPFRAPLAELIDRFGLRPSDWSEGLQCCTLDLPGPLLRGLAHPPVVSVQPQTDRNWPPHEILCYIRKTRFAALNLRLANRQLSKEFGPGCPMNSTNTRGFEWSDGFATITAQVFPPRLQGDWTRNNPRHRDIPGSATECCITIRPDYALPLTPDQTGAIHAAQRLSDRVPNPSFPWFGRSRDATGIALAPGLYRGQDLLLLLDARYRLKFVDLCKVQSIHLSVLTPAKGGGASGLSFATGANFASVSFVDDSYHNRASLESEARSLAEKLGLPFTQSETPDC